MELFSLNPPKSTGLLKVARTGVEPVICWLRTNRPGPLDERALISYKSLYSDIIRVYPHLDNDPQL